MCEFDGLSELPVSLSIQLISSDKNSIIFLTSTQDNAVGRYALIWFNLNNIAHFNILTENVSSSWFLYESIHLVISLIISSFTINVIICFFDKRKAKDKNKRCNIGKQETNFKHVHKLTERNNKEKHIEEISELMIQHQR